MINYYWVKVDNDTYNKRFKYIQKSRIDILYIKYLNKFLLLKISYDDYKKLNRIIPSSTIVKIVGKERIYDILYRYKYCVISFILCVFALVCVSHFIFFIDIETDNNEIKSIIQNELIKANITIFSYNKNFASLKKISEIIKNSNSSKIEWVEFDKNGVFLKVKVIERVSNHDVDNENYTDIVASKNGYIRNIKASSGWIVKNIDDYVEKGEIIVSGNILKNNEVVAKTKANASVYAEVWYIIKANKSLNYVSKVQNDIGKVKFVLNINGFEMTVFSLPKNVKDSKTVLFNNNSFSLYLINQKKYHRINKKYSSFDLENILKLKARNSIAKNYSKDEYIISEKTLKKYIKNGKMYIEIFFRCYEDIAEERDILDIKDEREEQT